MDGQWFPGQAVQFEGQPKNPWFPWESAIDVLTRLGLTTNLKLCLDAGDIASLPSSATKWLDLAGGGHDFDFGSAAGSDAADPTQNGTAGALTSAEYLGFDGGDYLTYDTSNPAWIENLHQNSALFTLAFWAYVGGTSPANQGLFGNWGGSSNNKGIMFELMSDRIRFIVANGSGTPALVLADTSFGWSVGSWALYTLSVDESAGNVLITKNSETSLTGSQTYSSPAATNASGVIQIGAQGAGVRIMSNLTRMAAVMAWEGVALTQAQVASVYAAMRGRFGV